MIKIIVIRYRIIKITVIVIIQLIIQCLRHMLLRQGQSTFDQLYFFRFYRPAPGRKDPMGLYSSLALGSGVACTG